MYVRKKTLCITNCYLQVRCQWTHQQYQQIEPSWKLFCRQTARRKVINTSLTFSKAFLLYLVATLLHTGFAPNFQLNKIVLGLKRWGNKYDYCYLEIVQILYLVINSDCERAKKFSNLPRVSFRVPTERKIGGNIEAMSGKWRVFPERNPAPFVQELQPSMT